MDMSEAAREALLHMCDTNTDPWPDLPARAAKPAEADAQHAALRSLRGKSLHATVEHPGGGHVRASVILHAIRPNRARILYPGMIHKDSPILLELPKYEGGTLEVKGRSLDCWHLSGYMHAVSVIFQSFADLTDMFPPGVILPEIPQVPAVAQPTKLHGHCAVLGADILEGRVLAHFATELGLTAHPLADFGSLLDYATSNELDVAIVDHEAVTQAGGVEHAAMRLYRVGLRSGLVVVSPPGGKDATTSMKVGELRVVSVARPSTKELISDSIETILKETQPSTPGVIKSSLHDEKARELVNAYVEQLREELEALLQFRDADEIMKVRNYIVRWRDTGTTFGFAPLTSASKAAVTALDASMSLEEAAPEVRRTISLVRRILACEAPTTTGSTRGAA